MSFLINPLDLNKFSKEEIEMAKYIAEQGWVSALEQDPEDKTKITYSFWRGFCEENHLFASSLAQAKGVLKGTPTRKTLIKTSIETRTVEGQTEYDLKFAVGCYRSKDAKTCGCSQCVLSLASYYQYLKEQEVYLKEVEAKDHQKKVERLEKEIDDLLYPQEIKDELKELLNLLKFIKGCRDNGLETPKPKLYYTLIKKEGVNHYALTNLIAKMLFVFEIQEDESVFRVDLKNPGDIISCSYKRLTIIEGLSALQEERDSKPTAQERKDEDHRTKVMDALMDDFENFMVVVRGTESEIKQFLSYDSKIPAIFKKQFVLKDFSDQEIYQLILKEAEKYSCQFGEGFEQACLNYIQQHRHRSPYKNTDFATYLFQQILMKELFDGSQEQQALRVLTAEDLPEPPSNPIDLEARLASLIGMKDVKEKLNELQSYLKYMKRIRPYQVNQPKLNLHMLITGNPGTGKTTVARIIAQTLYDLGYLETNKCLEVEAKDLIAGYVGQTALKTAKLIEDAMGGVLFIDEAYMLKVNDRGGTFNGEAVATLIKAMEDHKDQLVVIFAGYEKEMNEFVQSNSGILSRIGNKFHIKDYSLEELNQIALLKFSELGYELTEGSQSKLSQIIEEGMTYENFGNGRFVMNAIQAIILNHAIRSEELSDDQLFILTEADITSEIKQQLLSQLKQDWKSSQIGFQIHQ